MDRKRFEAIVAAFSGCRVVVLGDVMLDRYVAGSVDRISPEAPVPVVLVDREWDAVGGAGNVAANVRALGAACDLIGVVGEDDPGEQIGAILDAHGVGRHFVADGDRPTSVKTRVLARSQQVVRVDRERSGPPCAEADEALRSVLTDRLEGADVLVLEDYNKGVLTPELIRFALDRATAMGIPSVVDPKWQNFFAFAGATVFKPNRKELEGALGEHVQPEDPEWMEGVRRRLECTHLLLTLGAEGMALLSPGGALEHARAEARAVFDVSGAGDTVSAVVAASLAAGAEAGEAMGLATHAAAVEVAKAGVATVSPEEIWASMDGHAT